MVNKVHLIGNLGQDIQTHTFEGGGKIAKTSLATTEKWKDKTSGEKKQVTTWHNLVFHGALATLAETYLKKGSKIYVEGKIVNRSWEKDGKKHYMTEISVRDITFLGVKADGNSADQGHSQPQQQANEENSFVDDANEPDDLPF